MYYRASDYLSRQLGSKIHLESVVNPAPEDVPGGIVLRQRKSSLTERDEAYQIHIRPENIVIEGAPAGVLYGAVTLCHLLRGENSALQLSIPCCEIEDAPLFEYRGAMLDCSRHFLSISYLKDCVDRLLELKMNRLHLHLTDDEGWRMEIRAYPDLIHIGSRIEFGPGCDGYYTQAQLRDLVAYAEVRGVEVVPEIEIPGHAYAAVKSYSQLCCTGNPERNSGHQSDLYCAGRESTFEFLEAVLEEVLDVFPSKHIHLGGDEAPKDHWNSCPDCQGRIRSEELTGSEELQGYMFSRVAGFLQSRGRRVIGWEEVLDGSPSKDIVVQWWRNRTHGVEALRKAVEGGYRVIASPNSFSYLSFPVESDENFKPDRTSDLEKVYSDWFTSTSLGISERECIIGAECCVWTAHLREEHIDRMLFPRILACSEQMWSAVGERSFSEFHNRVYRAESHWRKLGVEYGPATRSTNPSK
jgi:hexosaminidase